MVEGKGAFAQMEVPDCRERGNIMKKSIVEKYFTQSNWTIAEIISVIVVVLSLIVAIFVRGGGPIGFPLAVVSIIVLIICRTTKIKDAEIDDLVNKIVEDKVEVKEPKQVISTFDFRGCKVKKGRDGKVRSTKYVISCFSLNPCSVEINAYNIDLVSGEVENVRYSIPRDENILLVEKRVAIGGAKKTIQIIENKASNLSLPVNTDDMNAYRIVEEICANGKN